MEPLIKKAIKCIDLVELSNLLLDDVVEVAINNAVAKSENKIDDAVVAMILPIVKAEIKKLISEKVEELKA
ncbi:MAG: hypothetical protein KBC28_11360 [Alphaproteobacteria bacterium]|jgi:hypothetical protein|nr:hypothetical protein [Alphaproteobacteria bacterium]